jgi:hypothetical protein
MKSAEGAPSAHAFETVKGIRFLEDFKSLALVPNTYGIH